MYKAVPFKNYEDLDILLPTTHFLVNLLAGYTKLVATTPKPIQKNLDWLKRYRSAI
jgi:hypothetical protein